MPRKIRAPEKTLGALFVGIRAPDVVCSGAGFVLRDRIAPVMR